MLESYRISKKGRYKSSMSVGAEGPARFWLGPPAPAAVTFLTRALQLALLLAVTCWVFIYLGGLRFSPLTSPDGNSNDTSGLFNWHPLLMTLGFPVLMAEALLAYRAPLFEMSDRQQSKLYHFGLHTTALGCTILGVVAAFKSHTLKRPTPIPNLYSAHSFLGMAVLSLLALQYLLGAGAYLWPKLSLPHRKALGPLHRYLGKAIFVAGLATMAAGIQEKQTFIQAFTKPASVYAGIMRLPAVIQLLLLLVGLGVLFHHALPAVPQEANDGTVSLVGGEAGREQDGAPAFEEYEDDHIA